MKTTLDHLPPRKQAQLQAITALLTQGAPTDMLILFGSHARGDWVEDPVTGYLSDFDVLAIVATEKIAEDHALWGDLLPQARTLAGATPVSLIVHDIKFINHEIRIGQYFFADIVNEGILLHDNRHFQLARPKALNDVERLELADHNFTYWFSSASEFWRGCRYYASRQLLNHAAFLLHQATERYYHAALLVWTGYKPRTHDIEVLGTQAGTQHPLLQEALPNSEEEDQRLFKLLKKAYIDSRYSMSYRITADELRVLQERVRVLGQRVRVACLEKMASLCGAAAVRPDLPQAPQAQEELLAELPPPPQEPQHFEAWKHGLIERSLQQGEAKGLRDGEAKGRLEGQQQTLLMILAARGIPIPDAARARILSTPDLSMLQRWTVQALNATSLAEALNP